MWVAVVALIIALVGGVPGVISIINHYRNRPIFYFSLVNTIGGDLIQEATGKKYSMIMLNGTVSNKGDKPLSPAYFNLEAKVEGKDIRFTRILIPENVTFPSDIEQIDVREPWKRDLQRFTGSVSTDTPVEGHLMFICDSVYGESLRTSRDITWKLTCIDVSGKSHRATVKPNIARYESVTVYPKHGITIQPKT